MQRFLCYVPPYYLIWWNLRYPNDALDPKKDPYVLQSCQNSQCTPHAANRWKRNLDTHLRNIGYINNSIDKAFYTHHRAGHLVAMLSTTVDDFYLSTKTTGIQDEFVTSLSSMFDITIPK